MENLHGYVVKDEKGTLLANLYTDRDGSVRVVRYPACSLGTYFYILCELLERGNLVK